MKKKIVLFCFLLVLSGDNDILIPESFYYKRITKLEYNNTDTTNYKDIIIQSMYLHEGIEYYPYSCSAGKLTIGCGHIILPTIDNFCYPITKEQIDSLLLNDINKAEEYYDKVTPVKLRLKDNKRYAIVKFIFHCGVGNYSNSTLKKVIETNQSNDVIELEWLRWCYHTSSTGELTKSDWQSSIREFEVKLYKLK